MAPVTIPGYGQPAAPPRARDVWDIVEGAGGPPAVKFGSRNQYGQAIPAQIGTSYTGILVDDLESGVVTNLDTGEVEYWDAEQTRPKEQIIAKIQTDLREHEEDDGLRRIFFKGQMLTALITEIKEKKLGRIGNGTRLTVELVDLKPPTKQGYSPQNIFRVTVGPEYFPWTPPEQRAVDNVLGTTATVGAPVQAVVQQPVQQYVQPAQEAFPGQVVPAPQPDAAAAAAVQQVLAAQQPVSLVAESDVIAVKSLIGAGLTLDVAVSQYGAATGKNSPEFLQALTAAAAGQ